MSTNPSNDRPGRRVVVVTGASGGVGRATARAFARRGDAVALLARGHAGLEGAASDVRELGGEPLCVPVDVGDADAVEAAADRIEDELGEIDVWVNDAMATVFAPVHEIEPEEYERATRTTYLGTVWGTMAALRRMRPRDRGAIVQVGSALSYRAIPLQAPYCGAKFAIRGFTDSLRTELEHDHSSVTITMVQLPAVNTPQFSWGRAKLPKHPMPVPPIFQPSAAAETVVLAAEGQRRELWLGGKNSVLMFLGTLAPGVLDRFLATTGYSSQQADAPLDPDRRDNLFSPADDERDHGPDGVFGDKASDGTAQVRFLQWLPRLDVLSEPLSKVLAKVM